MIQFDYEHSSFFGDSLKIVVEDKELRYRDYMIEFASAQKWKTLEIDEDRLEEFLASLEFLDTCLERYINEGVSDGRKYTLFCNTDKIKKTIHGYHEYQLPVKHCLQKLGALHPELEKVIKI